MCELLDVVRKKGRNVIGDASVTAYLADKGSQASAGSQPSAAKGPSPTAKGLPPMTGKGSRPSAATLRSEASLPSQIPPKPTRVAPWPSSLTKEEAVHVEIPPQPMK